MAYSNEYKEWVDNSVSSSFSVREVSANLSPTETNNNVQCDGMGFIGMYKQEDGLLMLKFPADNELGYELIDYPTVRKRLQGQE